MRRAHLSRRTLIRVGIVALQWVLLTLALGAVVVYSADSLRAFIEPNLDGSFVFLFTVLMFLPAVVGAGFGNLAGGYVRDDILGPVDQYQGVDQSSWYARRNSPSRTGRTDTGERDV